MASIRQTRAIRLLARLTAIGGAVAAALVSASCGGQRNPLPPTPPEVQLTMREYRFDYGRPIRQGRAIFVVRNAGRLSHRLSLIPMPPGSPSLADVISGSNPRAVTPLAGIPAIKPGTSDSFAVDLSPGRYLIIDLGIGPDHQSNAHRGMASDFEVT